MTAVNYQLKQTILGAVLTSVRRVADESTAGAEESRKELLLAKDLLGVVAQHLVEDRIR
jgi:hypothetical protein